MSYSKKIWVVGDNLKSADLNAMSSALEEVVRKVDTIEIPEVPSIAGLATKQELAAVKEMIPEIPSHDEFVSKTELADAIEEVEGKIPEAYDDADCVKFQKFTYNGQERRTVQLNNYDSISGVATDGTGHNLVMLSKWDVADFGAAGVHMNLNSKDAITINDSKVIATLDDIPTVPDVSGFASKTEVDAAIEEVKAAIPAAYDDSDLKASIKEVKEMIPEMPAPYDDSKCVKFVSIAGRDRIVLPNHVNMLGVGTDGGQFNLAMVSKWDVADFGSNAIAMNLNAKDGKVTINDDKIVATVDMIPSVEGFALKSDIPSVEDFALKADIPSLEGYAKVEDIPAAYDDSKCVKFVEIEGRDRIVMPNHVNMLGVGTDGGQYNLAMVSKWDVADFGSNAIAMNLNAKDGKVTINDDKVVATVDQIPAAYDDSKCVKYVEIDGRDRIVLPNHVNMLGEDTEGGQFNLAMVSKWNVADFGSSAIAMNLNAKDGKVTINDNKVVATMDVIEALVARIEALEAMIASGH